MINEKKTKLLNQVSAQEILPRCDWKSTDRVQLQFDQREKTDFTASHLLHSVLRSKMRLKNMRFWLSLKGCCENKITECVESNMLRSSWCYSVNCTILWKQVCTAPSALMAKGMDSVPQA